MKTNSIVGAALVAMLNCAVVNADLLGANSGLGGALGGTLNSTRDIGLSGHGNGSFGADFDSGPLRRATGNVADRAKERTRDTVSAARDRTTSTTAATKNAASEKVQEAKSIDPQIAADGNASVSAKK